MDNLIHMAIGNCCQKLLHIISYISFIYTPPINNPIKKFPSTAYLSDDVDEKLFLIDINNSNDIGMILELKCIILTVLI